MIVSLQSEMISWSSLKDVPEKFLGSNISYQSKSKDIHEIVKKKLEGMMENIKKCFICDDFKL